VEIYRVVKESSENIQDRIKKVICTGRSLEVQMSKRALSMGWDGYDWIKM